MIPKSHCKFPTRLLNYGAPHMKGTALAALLALPLAARAATVPLRVTPPPGWVDATPAKKATMLVATLDGPEQASFQLFRVKDIPLDNAGTVRLSLRDALEGIRQSSRRDFQSDGRVERRSFRNGVVAHMLRASLDGKPRLIVVLADAGGETVMGALNSAAPEAMISSLMEALEFPRVEGAIKDKGPAVSSDGQLRLELGGGLRSREPSEAEKRAGYVLIIQGSGSELLFQRIDDDSTPAAEQAAIVRAAAAQSAGAVAESATPAEEAPTPAGPTGVYSWVRLSDAAAGRLAVGWLPWGYWGYALAARGPDADGLLSGALAALQKGPSAVDRMVAATPSIPLESNGPDKRVLLAGGAAGALFLVILALWSRSRKNGTLPA